MTIWPPQPGSLRRPAYRSLADAVMHAVETGELKYGDRLPTHRNLAYDLKLSVQTVSRAYDELVRRGVITGEVGRGTFIRATRGEAGTPYLAQRQEGELIDLSLLKPVLEPMHGELMRRALGELADDLPDLVYSSFRPARALSRHRPAAVQWLDKCGIRLGHQSVVLTNGSTSAMALALMTVANGGDLVATEALSHHTLKPLARYQGLRLRGLPSDEAGMLPEALDKACRREGIRAVFLMPAGLGPQAVIMPEERRSALVEVATRHDLQIIENDAWGPMQSVRHKPIAMLAPERTFYFTGLTKCVMPGLRLGFLVVPEAFEAAAANRHLVTSWMATPLIAEIAARWIKDGTAERVVAWQSEALAERNRLARRVFAATPVLGHANGMHIWLPLPAAWTEDDFVSHARQHGVAVAPGSAFAVADELVAPAVRICIGAGQLAEVEKGLRVAARLVRGQPEPALLAN
ncbi:PLP-dependent aminotransferase family protein [Pseudohoeflea coraliihabitans]|uniref:PLP-dependent aminotransferase family protein n=1 Tax=Pseudohoeflea coraliihabitans TaxID=2860393 RepID=A0ABS6WJT3_9HYPH|nr:PLP-dependent aminotransferase family protein [Pseudohoeflea sp. DP4N28-3]MBW3096204.1 PLP-dependent aminotransferase family protein [Pseudohoeflea sp. DP4N28-3]